VAGGEPLYVLELDPASGTVVLGRRAECSTAALALEQVNLIGRAAPASGELRCQVQVRYHHAAAPARVALHGSTAEVLFDEPQAAVAPGQGAAFYQGERLLGGGWIVRAPRAAPVAAPAGAPAAREARAGS
jgi:tRNA-specific 2-thiouridylase